MSALLSSHPPKSLDCSRSIARIDEAATRPASWNRDRLRVAAPILCNVGAATQSQYLLALLANALGHARGFLLRSGLDWGRRRSLGEFLSFNTVFTFQSGVKTKITSHPDFDLDPLFDYSLFENLFRSRLDS